MVVDFFRIRSGHKSPFTYFRTITPSFHWGPSLTLPRFTGVVPLSRHAAASGGHDAATGDTSE